MKRVAVLPLLLMSAAIFAATEVPCKVSVGELLAHANKYDKQRIDVTGYYTAGMEDSQLWPSFRAAKQSRTLDDSIYIDPRIWVRSCTLASRRICSIQIISEID